MRPWMVIIIAAGLFWGAYAAWANGIAIALPLPREEPINEIFEYCYSTDDAFVICKLKTGG